MIGRNTKVYINYLIHFWTLLCCCSNNIDLVFYIHKNLNKTSILFLKHNRTY